jgi:vacuolar-type H+-ATPase subunit D/Vma8
MSENDVTHEEIRSALERVAALWAQWDRERRAAFERAYNAQVSRGSQCAGEHATVRDGRHLMAQEE